MYIIIFKEFKTIANDMLFASYEEAWDWKKAQIEARECLNHISIYDVKRLDVYKSL